MTSENFSPEAIEQAAQAAQAANEAHIRLHTTTEDIERIDSVRGARGISVDEDEYSLMLVEQDEARQTFEAKVGETALVYGRREEDSYVKPETGLSRDDAIRRLGGLGLKADVEKYKGIFEFENVLRDKQEFILFGRAQGYPARMPELIWDKLLETGSRHTRPNLRHYRTREDGAIQFIHLIGTYPDMRIDILSLEVAVKEALEEGSLIFAEVRGKDLSFLADYLNYALPREEKLTVEFPVEKKKQIGEMDNDEIRAILLTRTKVDNREIALVTGDAIRRTGEAHGYQPTELSHATLTLNSMAQELGARTPQTTIDRNTSIQVDEHVVSIKRSLTQQTVEWGIDPAKFVELITEADNSPRLAERLASFAGFTRTFLVQYAGLLRRHGLVDSGA